MDRARPEMKANVRADPHLGQLWRGIHVLINNDDDVDNNNTNEEDTDDDDYEYEEDQDIPDDDIENDDDYDHIDQDEVEELLADDGSNPTVETADIDDDRDNENDNDETELTESESDDETASQSVTKRRSTRATSQPDRLWPTTFKGKMYLQTKKNKLGHLI